MEQLETKTTQSYYNIKDCTNQMIIDIRSKLSSKTRTTDKEIAEMLKITPASISRLYTKATKPNIETWIRILKLHMKLLGNYRTSYLLEQINT